MKDDAFTAQNFHQMSIMKKHHLVSIIWWKFWAHGGGVLQSDAAAPFGTVTGPTDPQFGKSGRKEKASFFEIGHEVLSAKFGIHPQS